MISTQPHFMMHFKCKTKGEKNKIKRKPVILPLIIRTKKRRSSKKGALFSFLDDNGPIYNT